MPVYSYKALDQSGRKTEGELTAQTRREAVARLSGEGIFPTSLAETGTVVQADGQAQDVHGGTRRQLKGAQLAIFTRNLATLVEAGVPLVSGLDILAGQAETQQQTSFIARLGEHVRKGDSFSEALRRHPETFSLLYAGTVRAGEAAGALDTVLHQLADFMDRENELRSNVSQALTYPAVVLSLGIVSVIFILTFVVPTIVSSVASVSEVLPWPTLVLMWLGSFFTRYGLLLALGIAAAVLVFRRIVKTEAGRLRYDTFKLKVPVIGDFIRHVAVSRFTRTLGLLTKSAVPVIEALEVARDTCGNEKLAHAVSRIIEQVRSGHSLAEPLKRSGEFPAMVANMVAVGEETGRLDELLLRAARAYDAQVEQAVKKLNAVLPAALIILLGLIIGFIVIAVLLPIFETRLTMMGGG